MWPAVPVADPESESVSAREFDSESESPNATTGTGHRGTASGMTTQTRTLPVAWARNCIRRHGATGTQLRRESQVESALATSSSQAESESESESRPGAGHDRGSTGNLKPPSRAGSEDLGSFDSEPSPVWLAAARAKQALETCVIANSDDMRASSTLIAHYFPWLGRALAEDAVPHSNSRDAQLHPGVILPNGACSASCNLRLSTFVTVTARDGSQWYCAVDAGHIVQC